MTQIPTVIPDRVAIQVGDLTLVGSRHPAIRPTGVRVLLNHGFSDSRIGPGRALVDLARLLTARGVEVFAFDRAGHGESEGRFHDVTIPHELRQIGAMIDHVRTLGDGPLHLLGHSLGAMETALVAATRPGQIASMTLWAPAAVVVDDLAQDRIQGQPIGPARAAGVFDFQGQGLGLGFVDTARGLDPFAGLAEFDAPVHLHQGARDEVVPAHYAERYAAAFGRRATLHLYPEADHGWTRLADRQRLLERSADSIAPRQD